MEALLLTLDVICMILLLRNVVRVSRSGDAKDLGIFRYVDSPSEGTAPMNKSKGKTSA